MEFGSCHVEVTGHEQRSSQKDLTKMAAMPMKSFVVLLLTINMSKTYSSSCSIHVVESHVRSKAGECLEACEDELVVTPDFACVVDGATSPTGKRWTTDQLTGGKWAANVLCRAVQHSLTPEMSACKIIATLTKSLYSAYQQESNALEVMQTYPEERATASLVLYSKYLRQVILVGDCQAAFLNENGKITQHVQPDKYCDKVTSAARAMFWQAQLLSDEAADDSSSQDGDPGRDLIQPLLKIQRRFQNNMKAPALYRYWAMDGFPVAEEGIEVHDVSDDSIREVILASDGYPKLYPTLQETEAHLQKLIRDDPMMIRDYLAAKGVREGAESFDDRAYLRIRITN